MYEQTDIEETNFKDEFLSFTFLKKKHPSYQQWAALTVWYLILDEIESSSPSACALKASHRLHQF